MLKYDVFWYIGNRVAHVDIIFYPKSSSDEVIAKTRWSFAELIYHPGICN